jgi:type VI secretion system protein ImpA
MPLTEGRGMAYSTVDFEGARRRSAAGDADTPPRLADMEAAKRATSPAFAARFNADAQYCLDALARLEQVADARLGQDSPGFAAAREAVEAMLHVMPATAPTPAPVQAQAEAPAVADAPVAPAATAPIRTRAQAIAQLRALAQFFRETEPHSPVSYFAEKAAAAGEQDLHTWLKSVIKDQASLAHIEEMLGVPPSN